MDRATFIELLESHADRVHSFARYFLRDAEEAADVVQEAFLRLWERCEAVDARGRVAWLHRVVHNLCVDRRRRRRSWRDRLGRLGAAVPDEYAVGRRSSSDPERDLLLDEQQRRVLDALGQLPPETRSVVLMHYYEGLKYREIAAILGSNENAIKAKVHRGRRALRRVLADPEAEDLALRQETG